MPSPSAPRLAYFRSGRTRFRSEQHLFKNSTEEKDRDRGRGSKQKEKKTNQVREACKKHIDIQSCALTINFLLLHPVSLSYHYA